MNAGVLFFVIADIKDYLVTNQMLRDDGTVILTDTAKDIEIAAVVERSLKAHGVAVQAQVDKIIQALPLIIGLFIN